MKSLTFLFFVSMLLLSNAPAVSAQRPRGGGRPEWFKQIDINGNDLIEEDEYRAAADLFFKKYDADGDGILENAELPPPPAETPPDQQDDPPRSGGRPARNDHPPRRDDRPSDFIPPFLFVRINEADLTRADFDKRIAQKFGQIDHNKDGGIDLAEVESIDPHRHPRPEEEVENVPGRQGPPTAEFLGAEMRFGDKLIKDAPFSAAIVTENTRRLFDGSVVTKQSKGAIYRDGQGRTRREQTLDSIGAISISEPQELVFINDFVAKTHFFVDVTHKSVRRQPIPDNRPPEPERGPANGKTESLGTRLLEGVKVEGIKTTFEIPVGQIGNASPIQVVMEKWFSQELQITVMSRLIDPLAGEQIFKLVNIRLGEPPAELFAVPKNFKLIKE